MGKFDGVLLVSDFDDTLYASNCTVPAANVQALTYFIREGGVFTVATGRAHPTMAPMIHLAPINAPVVLSNGAALYDFQAGRMVHQTYLPDRVAGDMAEVCAVFPALGFESYYGDEISVWNPNQVTWNHLRRAQASCTERPIAEMPTPWNKAILQQRNSLLRQIQRYMLERWGEHYEVIFSNEVLLELTCKGSTKGGMVRYLAGHLGIDPSRIYCVGDNQNDLPMLEISAIPFAPANCAPEVRAWGARIVASCDAGCLAEIVDELDRIYEPLFRE